MLPGRFSRRLEALVHVTQHSAAARIPENAQKRKAVSERHLHATLRTTSSTTRDGEQFVLKDGERSFLHASAAKQRRSCGTTQFPQADQHPL